MQRSVAKLKAKEIMHYKYDRVKAVRVMKQKDTDRKCVIMGGKE